MWVMVWVWVLVWFFVWVWVLRSGCCAGFGLGLGREVWVSGCARVWVWVWVVHGGSWVLGDGWLVVVGLQHIGF